MKILLFLLLNLVTFCQIISIHSKFINFTFSKKIFEQSKFGNFTNQQFMNCNSQLNGMYEIVSSQKIKLYPAKTLPTSTKINCHPNQFLKSKGISKSFQFKTDNFKLDKVLYDSFLNKLSTHIWFNEAVSYKNLKKNLKMYTQNNKSKHKVSYKLFPQKKSKHFIIDTLIKDNTNQNFIIEISNQLLSIHQAKFQSDYIGYINTKKSKVFKENQKLAHLIFQDQAIFEAQNQGQINLKVYLPQLLTNQKPLDFIKINPKVKIQVIDNSYNYYSNNIKSPCYISFKGDFKPDQNYKITLLKGLKTRSFELKKDKINNLLSPHYLPYFKLISKKPRLSPNNQSFEVQYTNQKQVQVVVEKLLNQNYRYFINFQRARLRDFHLYSKVIKNYTINLNDKKNIINHKVFKLSDFLNQNSGTFRLSFYSSKKNTKTLLDQKVFHLSDLSITAMLTDKKLLINTQSIAKLSAVSNTIIKVFSKKNQLLTHGITNSEGILILPIKHLKNKPFSIIATNKKQKSFLLLNSPVGKAKQNSTLIDQYKAYIHLERGLIRPSESIHSAIIIKNKEFQSISIPLKFQLRDPSGFIVQEKIFSTNDKGLFEIQVKSHNYWKTGVYRYEVYLGQILIGSKKLQIESFLAPKVKNTIDIQNKHLYQNENIKISLTSKYYFGAPAANLKATLKLSAFTKTNQLKSWPDYHFGDHKELINNNDFLLKTYPFTLKDDARMSFHLPLVLNKQSSLMLNGLVSFSVFDDSKEVNSFENFTLYPSKKMIGIKALFKNRVKSSKDHDFKIILIDPKSNKKIESKLQVKVYKKVWQYQYDSQRNYGQYQEQHILIETKEIQAQQKLTLNHSQSGNYYLEVKDRVGGHKSTYSYYVSGWSFEGPNKLSENTLNIQSNLKTIKSNKDIIKLDIQSQMPGKLLIVVEDSDILFHQFYTMSGTTAHIVLPKIKKISSDFTIHAYLTRPSNFEKNILPFRSYGSIDIKVSQEKHHIYPKFKVNSTTKSNQNVVVTVSSLKKGDICIISAVDQGIHDMISEKYIDPFLAFQRKKLKTLEYYDFYNHLDFLISNLNYKSFGGDEPSESRRKRHLSPDSLNERVQSFSHWSSFLIADSNGEVKWKFPIKSFQGEIKLKTIVINESQIGGNHVNIISQDPIYVKASLPRYLVNKDRLKIPYKIFNSSNKEQNLHLKVSLNDKSIYLKQSKYILKPKQRFSSNFILNTKLLNNQSKGILNFKLMSSTGLKYSKSYTLPSIPLLQNKTYSKMVALKEDITITFPDKFFKEQNPQLIITVKDDPRQVLKKSMQNLIAYPYGCTEQTSSKLMALNEIFKIVNDKEKPIIQSFIKAGMLKLFNLQTNRGDFNYWQGGNYINQFASIYTSHILLKLEQNNFLLTKPIKKLILQNLHKKINQNNHDFQSLYIAWILKNYDHLSRSNYHALFEKYKNSNKLMVQSFLYALSKMFQENHRANQLEIKILKSLKKYLIKREYSLNFNSTIRNKSFSLYLYLSNGGKRSKVQKYLDLLFLKLSQNELYSTQEKAFTLMLFSDQMKDWPHSQSKPTLLINNKKFKLSSKTVFKQIINEKQIKLSIKDGFSYLFVELLGKAPLTISNDNKLDSKITIDTSLVDSNDKQVNIHQLKVSQKIFKKIIINTSQKMANLVLISKVPSCFESINPRLNKSFKLPKKLKQSNIIINNLDLRDDRLIAFLQVNKKGVYYHPIQISFAGKCSNLETSIEAMYDSRIFDYHLKNKSYTILK